MPDHNHPDSLPDGLDLNLEDIAEHMRAHAMVYLAAGAEHDCIGQWLWNLAERLAAEAKKIPRQRKPRD